MRPLKGFVDHWQRARVFELNGGSRGPGRGQHDHRWSLRMATLSLAGMSLWLWLLLTAVSRLTLG